MEVSLSLVLDLVGNVKLDLMKESLSNIDLFTTNYVDGNDIREMFGLKISNFLKEKESLINSFSKNKNGRIVITYYDKNNFVRFIPVLYRDNKCFMDVDYDYSLFMEACVSNYDMLYDLSRSKHYLFSPFMLEKVSYGYKKKKEQKEVIKMVIKKFKSSNNSYFYIRNFTNSFKCFTKEIEVFDMNTTNDKSYSTSDDIYFNDCGYEDLFNYYGLDTIIRYSSNRGIPYGLKKF